MLAVLVKLDRMLYASPWASPSIGLADPANVLLVEPTNRGEYPQA